MANFNPVAAEIDSGVWGYSSKLQRVSRLGFVTAATSLTTGQPNFARCLAVSWAGTRTGITELSQTAAPPIFGWAAITLGIGPHATVVEVNWPDAVTLRRSLITAEWQKHKTAL